MFRENVLTQDDVIDRIASTMVAVAVDRHKATDPKTKEGRFLLPLLKRNPEAGSPCIYSPEGKLLGGFRGYDFAQAKKLIEDCLSAFGPVAPRKATPVEIHPFRGKGWMADDGVRLAAYIRTSDESLAFVHPQSPVISSVTLSEKEFRAFAPQGAFVGAKWELPDEVARKLSRVSSPLCYQHAPRPDWVTGVRLHAKVQAIQDGAAWVRYEGQIASAHRIRGATISDQEAKLTGYGVYDLKTKRMRSLFLVGSGALGWPEDPTKRVTFDALVEWRLEARR